MLSQMAKLLISGVVTAVTIGSFAMAAPATASPVGETRVQASMDAKPVVPGVNVRRATTSCNGENFTYGNITLSLGGGMWYYFGLRDGKIRMARVYTENGGNATLKLASRSWSGAFVESQTYGSDYCITFPGSSTGVNVTGIRWGNTYIARERW